MPADNLTGWNGGTNAVAPTFYYYLKERSNSGVKIEIYDASKKKIKDINGSSSKGLNRVYWDLTINAPKVAQGGYIAQSTVLFSSVIGPKVDIGTYKVVLKTDGKEYVQNILIEANPAKGLSAQTVGLLHKQSMRLYQLHERLHTLVDSLDKTVKTISLGDTAAASVKEKLSKLDSFKREIVELNRKSIFFDEFGVQFFDEEHSADEERFLMLGMSSGAKLLIVCHCEREHGEVIRIISARKATKRESAFYRGEQL